METSLTLEEEISQRRETVENSLRCVQGFLDSVDFYIRKLELHTSQDPTTYDIDLNHHLFEFLHAEAMRAVEKAALITKLSSKALLPVTYVDPHSVIMLAVSHLTALSYEYCKKEAINLSKLAENLSKLVFSCRNLSNHEDRRKIFLRSFFISTFAAPKQSAMGPRSDAAITSNNY